MSQVKCPDCGTYGSYRAVACPHCARPHMKLKAEAAVREAAERNFQLDYSADGTDTIIKLIHGWEMDARIACDLDDDADVSDTLLNVYDFTALGAYYGELFVRHAGAVWVDGDREGEEEPAVVRNEVIFFPVAVIRDRVYGSKKDLTTMFQTTMEAMTKGAST